MLSYLFMCPTGLKGNPTDSGPGPHPGPLPDTFPFQPSPPLPPQPQISCAPGTCFRQSMCIPTSSGNFQCAPCPDGYTGDGVHCDDVDEVGTMFCKVYSVSAPGGEIMSMSWDLIILYFLCFSVFLAHVSLASGVWTLLLAFAACNALRDTPDQS